MSMGAALIDAVRASRRAALALAGATATVRSRALEAIAQQLELNQAQILAANQADCQTAQAEGMASALYGRLVLSESKLAAAIAGVRDVARLPDPLGTVQLRRELDEGLVLERLSCPLGVLGVIFEARPDAAIQIAALAVKSGNGVILKGGKEAARSCVAIVAAVATGLSAVELEPDVVQLLTTREETQALLALEGEVDLIIPRGSNEFVRFVQANTQIPVLGHAEGLCHLYVDAAADVAMAVEIAVDAKTQYPSACNTIETLLVHWAIADRVLGELAIALQAQGVELRGDDRALALWQAIALEQPVYAATELDWSSEYSDLILSVRVVDAIDEALDHIAQYGSGHTEAIVTEDPAAAARFLAQVDAAGVFHNCSTRFADGFRYGFGAEVGISTHRLPPRGPVGLDGLVTYKYRLRGQGQVVSTYSGAAPKPFTHRDLSLEEEMHP